MAKKEKVLMKMPEGAATECSKEAFCWLMEEHLQEDNARKKGLSALVLTNFKTWKKRTVGVFYKKTAHDKGIMLNFCPWCGKEILWQKAGEEEDSGSRDLQDQEGGEAAHGQ